MWWDEWCDLWGWDTAMILPDGYIHHPPPPEDDRGGNVTQLPALKTTPRQPHVLGEAFTIAPDVSETGFEQKEKTCKNCGAVRVTVLGPMQSGLVWRAWRSEAGAPLVDVDTSPPCPLPKAAP